MDEVISSLTTVTTIVALAITLILQSDFMLAVLDKLDKSKPSTPEAITYHILLFSVYICVFVATVQVFWAYDPLIAILGTVLAIVSPLIGVPPRIITIKTSKKSS